MSTPPKIRKKWWKAFREPWTTEEWAAWDKYRRDRDEQAAESELKIARAKDELRRLQVNTELDEMRIGYLEAYNGKRSYEP